MPQQVAAPTYTAHLPNVTYPPRRHWARVVLWVVLYMLPPYLTLGGGFSAAWWEEAFRPDPAPPVHIVAIVLAFAGVSVFLAAWHIAGLRYRISYCTLHVGRHPLAWAVALDDIQSVTPRKRPFWPTIDGSLAWHGLVIERRGSSMPVFISPRLQGDFLRDLADRCPHIELRDGGLAPRK